MKPQMTCSLLLISLVVASFCREAYGNAGPISVEGESLLSMMPAINSPYFLLLIVPVVLVLAVLGVVTLVVLMAMKKNQMNLKE